jgi:hypothetical protein
MIIQYDDNYQAYMASKLEAALLRVPDGVWEAVLTASTLITRSIL